MSMSDEDWAEFYVELAIIARRDGIGALEPLVAVVDDEVLSTGLKATIMDRLSAAQILAVMKDSVQDLRVRLKRREAMVLAGSLGIQMGHKPQDLVEVARTAAVESGQRIHDAGYPRPTA
jgi:flagellar motor component MotA